MKKQIKIKRFDNFLDENEIKTKICFNFLPKTELKQSFSVAPATFPLSSDAGAEWEELNIEKAGLTSIDGITSFRQYFASIQEAIYRLLLFGNDKKVYINQLFYNNTDIDWLYKLTFNNAPKTLTFKKNDEDAIILTDENKMVLWETNQLPYVVENVPVITSMCMNDGVLFCTIKQPAFKIWYATDLDAENVGSISSNSNYISLEDELGDAQKILAFDEEVYIFREYGISKINYLQKNITVSQVYASNSRILPNTVSVCGNMVFFMAYDGIYTFNGTRVNKLNIKIEDMLDGLNLSAVASSLSHYYFLALRLNYNDDVTTDLSNLQYVNNSILVVDTNDFSFHLMRGYDVLQFHPFHSNLVEKMLFCSNSLNKNKLFEICFNSSAANNITKVWESEFLSKLNNTKLITNLIVDASKNVSFVLQTDRQKSYTFTTTQDGINKFNFRFFCKNLKLKIISKTGSAEVKNVELEYYDY